MPGLWMQRITTREPDDTQLEIAILSMKKCLWREENLNAPGMETVVNYPDFDAAINGITNPGPDSAEGDLAPTSNQLPTQNVSEA